MIVGVVRSLAVRGAISAAETAGVYEMKLEPDAGEIASLRIDP